MSIQIPQIDVSIGVLTVLYQGPFLLDRSIDAAGEQYSLEMILLGDTCPQEPLVKLSC